MKETDVVGSEREQLERLLSASRPDKMASAKTEVFILSATMSNQHLPAELLDLIVDLLYDSTDALESCCLVSKSWIPRARKHLFTDIKFTAEGLQSWKTRFPDPFTSPARYTKNLLITCPLEVAVADGKEGGWITAFTRVVRFELDAFKVYVDQPGSYLTPFYGFSPALKSLHLTFYCVPSRQLFHLICSFPLLDDLAVTSHYYAWSERDDTPDDRTTNIQSLTLPSFTGSLELDMWTGMDFMAPGLLSLSGGLNFRRLQLSLKRETDPSLMTALVEECCPTLESLEVECDLCDREPLGLIDLSKATQLKDMVFVSEKHPHWIVMTLRTITPDHRQLQRVSIVVHNKLYRTSASYTNPPHSMHIVGESSYREWLELDRLLAQLWESRSICLEILLIPALSVDTNRVNSIVEGLLPELMTRGLARLAWRE